MVASLFGRNLSAEENLEKIKFLLENRRFYDFIKTTAETAECRPKNLLKLKMCFIFVFYKQIQFGGKEFYKTLIASFLIV